MGTMLHFPSPVTDHHEVAISLYKELIRKPAETFFICYGAKSWREGI